MRKDTWNDLNSKSTINSLHENAHRGTMSKELGSKKLGSSGQRERAPRTSSKTFKTTTVLLSILATAPGAMAQNCISLAGSQTCSAFNTSSISTDAIVAGRFPFLQYVDNVASFDDQLNQYISTSYVQQKYRDILGCDNINLTNTTNLYARFTTTVICNSIIQNSREICGLTAENSRPVCAETCAQFATSEAVIATDSQLCSNPKNEYQDDIRADFVTCALPANALSGTCIDGAQNEPNNCGFRDSTIGLCQYCREGGQNSTDTCCYNSRAEELCASVVLPTITGLMSFSTALPTATPTSVAPPTNSTGAAAAPSNGGSGLSRGAIAGIVIGSVAGLILLIGLIVLLVMCLRRRNGSQAGSVFNQPAPARKGQAGMAYNPVGTTTTPAGYEVLPGGRIARMSALEGHSGDSPPRDGMALGTAGAAGYAAGRRKHHNQSSSDEYSPVSHHGGVLRPPPTGRRTGSLSSNSVLGEGGGPNSPNSGSGDMSSPVGMTSQQSEQLAFFKDYYSQDEIHTGDKVSTLWAYQPRAGDEFALERGDMLKVVGIWDDGWATGILLEEKADEWEARKLAQRDSGVSNTSGRRDVSPDASGEIKAFPLVCVCLPEHWRRTIEGDGSTETGSSGARPNI